MLITVKDDQIIYRLYIAPEDIPEAVKFAGWSALANAERITLEDWQEIKRLKAERRHWLQARAAVQIA